MRFPRFHFGTAIALGLPMLCMSAVPVFADGLSTPTVSSSVNESTVSLSWDAQGSADHFVVRRSTTSTPASISSGTLVTTTADNSTLSYEDTDLNNGTYYYGVFAIDSFDFATAPGSTGPLVINVQSGGSAAHRRIRKRYAEIAAGLHGSADGQNNAEPPSLSDVGIFVPGTGSIVAKPIASPKKVLTNTEPSRRVQRTMRAIAQRSDPRSSAPTTVFQDRVCSRIAKHFSGSSLERVNARIEKRLGFMCNA